MLTGSRTSRGLGAVLAGVTLAGAVAVTLASPAAAATGGVLIYGLTDNNQLVSFRADTPGTTIGAARTIAGLSNTEDVVGIDVRPATGQLFAVVNNSGTTGDRLITINPDTGAVLSTVSLSEQLVGNAFGVDFNPQNGQLRIVSDGTTGTAGPSQTNGSNASFNVTPDTGMVLRQGDLNPGDPAVRAAAYSNNQSNNVSGGPGVTSGSTSATNTTELLDIDVQGQDRLVQQAVATGALTFRGNTGRNVDESATATASVGFDIEAVTNVGYAVFEETNGNDSLFRVDRATGVATLVGAFATANDVEDIAVASPRLVVSDAQANEGQSANVTVTRTGDTADTATAVLTPVANGSATSGADFDPATRTVTFAAGATTATAAFPLVTDTVAESSETFTVTITSIQSNGNNVAAGRSGVVTILDGQARNTNGRFNPVTPSRVFDSRTNGGSRIQAGQDRVIPIAGRGGIPATGVTAVVVNVTNTLATARGDLQVYPTGQRPSNRTSNLNFFAGETVPVQVQTGVGTDGSITVSVNTGNTHVIVDVFGYYGDSSDTIAGSSGYTALQPQRLLDTRTNRTPVVANADRQVVVGGNAGVPATATAVILNTTVLGTPANADLQVYPTGQKPTVRTSNLNVRRGQTKANSVTVALGTNGSIGLSVSQNSAQVVLDVLGYYSVESRGRFIPLTPSRILDTRGTGGSGNSQPLRAGQDRNIQVSSNGGVPGGAAAAVLSVTGTGASNPVDLQVFPTGNRPTTRTSTVNFRPGEAVANVAVATLGTNGQITLSLSQGSAAVILDAVGYILND